MCAPAPRCADEDIKRLKPDEASLRAMDKIGYRYPRGESYFDILSRLDPLVHEMESYHEPLLVVSHQAVLRVLYAYLMGMPRTSAPRIEIPLHTVMKITCARIAARVRARARAWGVELAAWPTPLNLRWRRLRTPLRSL